MTKEQTGQKFIFKTLDADLLKYSGQRVTLLKVLKRDNLYTFKVETSDSKTFCVLKDELFEIPEKVL